METIRTIQGLRSKLAGLRRERETTVGFMPTLGYMHEGHLSLIRAAKAQDGIVVLSIFVNPLQFGPNEDFAKYPRDTARDLKMAEEAGVDVAFVPDVEEMYPTPMRTKVSVSEVSERLCGASRPGHFDGVAAVVLKLFNIVQPDHAYFGLKDAQQVAVIEQMVHDLNVPVKIVPCPTLRESDGLAMSSRNVYLSPEERSQAPILNRALAEAEEALQNGEVRPEQLRQLVANRISEASLSDIDYVEVMQYPSLTPLDPQVTPKQLIVAVAVRFGKTRLIDNRILDLERMPSHV
ncbi:MAG: pantoate--beta-alanine ligase [Paenibacillaceae bacterium]|jgi:pantoate--beta-alanine ligase|nr:pantoate--beta-alanine ligase [Paenibacillaceae bacterium]